MAPMADHPAPPREPEIEFLGKLVRRALLAFRGATALAGAAAIGYAAVKFADPPPVTLPDYGTITPSPVGEAPGPIAPFFVWLCIGIPPLVPTRWLFGRGRWPMLLVGILLWLVPSRLEGDSDYGYIIRFFASLVAIAVLGVWRVCFGLTRAAHGP